MKNVLRQIFSNNLGLSLMESVVGLGILGLVGSGVMMSVQKDQDVKKLVEVVSNEHKEFDSVTRALSSKQICDAVLSGRGGGGAVINLTSLSYNLPDGTRVDLLKVGGELPEVINDPTPSPNEESGSNKIRNSGDNSSDRKNENGASLNASNTGQGSGERERNEEVNNDNPDLVADLNAGIEKPKIKAIRLQINEGEAVFEVDHSSPGGRTVSKNFSLPVITGSGGQVIECYHNEADAYSQNLSDITLSTCGGPGAFVYDLAEQCFIGDFAFTSGSNGYSASMSCPEGQTVRNLNAGSENYRLGRPPFASLCEPVFNGPSCGPGMIESISPSGTITCRSANSLVSPSPSAIYENTECRISVSGGQLRLSCSCTPEACREYLYCPGQGPESNFCGGSCGNGTKVPNCPSVESNDFCPNIVVERTNGCGVVNAPGCENVRGTQYGVGCPNLVPANYCVGETIISYDRCGAECPIINGTKPADDPDCDSCDSYPDQEYTIWQDSTCENGQRRQTRSVYWPNSRCQGDPIVTPLIERFEDDPTCPPICDSYEYTGWGNAECVGTQRRQTRTASWEREECRDYPLPDSLTLEQLIEDPTCTVTCQEGNACTQNSDCGDGTCNTETAGSCTGPGSWIVNDTNPTCEPSGMCSPRSGSQAMCEATPNPNNCSWRTQTTVTCTDVQSESNCNAHIGDGCSWQETLPANTCSCPSTPPPPPACVPNGKCYDQFGSEINAANFCPSETRTGTTNCGSSCSVTGTIVDPPLPAPQSCADTGSCTFPASPDNQLDCSSACPGASMCADDPELPGTRPAVACEADWNCYCIQEGDSC